MPNVKFKNHLHLHFLVFIAGFTAILGELITIQAIPLVWYRMTIAGILMFFFLRYKRIKLSIPLNVKIRFFLAGVVIALHWITFFAAIKTSNISITLAMFSTGAFFASLIEPLFYRRRIISYEIVFGLLIVIGVSMIVQIEGEYFYGIILGILSAFLSSLFAVMNGKFVQNYNALTISFYEFISGILFISLFLLFDNENGFSSSFFNITFSDFIYLLILASVCTAYAFIASVYVMKHITPFSVVLTYNLEPVYGMIMAFVIFPDKEKMPVVFYIGSSLIILTVLLNAIIKYTKNKN
ncbi:MAG: DMT family transporter [Flavobacteriaceae bacterium]